VPLTYAIVSSRAAWVSATAPIATTRRYRADFLIIMTKPWSGSSTTRVSGIRKQSKSNSAVSWVGTPSLRPEVKPGVSDSTDT